jgi:hypothetical protein
MDYFYARVNNGMILQVFLFSLQWLEKSTPCHIELVLGLEFYYSVGKVGWALGCSDFHFFHISGNFSPSLFSLGPKSSENVFKKTNLSSAVLSEFFRTFSKIYIFSEFFKTNFRSQY